MTKLLKNTKSAVARSLRTVVLQMTSGEDVAANVQAILYELEQLVSAKCDLICLPENALFLRMGSASKATCSFTLKESFWGALQEYSLKNNCVILIGSAPVKKGKKSTNSTLIISNGKAPKVVYNKIHLFDVDVPGAPAVRESETHHYGRRPQMLKVKGWNIGLSICYDVRFAELYQYYVQKKVDLILVPAAFLVPTGKAHWHVLLRARAIESQAFVIAAAQCGGHTNGQGLKRETYGHSLVIGPWGDVITDLGDAGSGVAVVDLKYDEIMKVRRQIPMVNHRRL